jgi:ABC-type lipoprotein release transport system permease subunit
MSGIERYTEIGTLRAIGYNRFQSFILIFLEIFILSLIFFSIAFILNLVLVLIFGKTGIYIGKGTIAYALGGESVYPLFDPSDTLTALIIITGFSLFAPLKPGLRLCCQKITDLLAQNQKPLSAILTMIKNALGLKRYSARQIVLVEDGINED